MSTKRTAILECDWCSKKIEGRTRSEVRRIAKVNGWWVIRGNRPQLSTNLDVDYCTVECEGRSAKELRKMMEAEEASKASATEESYFERNRRMLNGEDS